jgi:hypothetical protein
MRNSAQEGAVKSFLILVSFVPERSQRSLGDMLELIEQFEPVFRFVSLLFCDGHLGEELGSGTSMAGGSVVCSN